MYVSTKGYYNGHTHLGPISSRPSNHGDLRLRLNARGGQGLGSREVTSDANHGMPPLSDACVPYFHAAWFLEDVCPLAAGRHPCSFGGYVLDVAC